MHDDVRIWPPGSVPSFRENRVSVLYGVVTGFAADTLEVRLSDGATICVSPTIAQAL